MKDIFGEPILPKKITCNIYHDEREVPNKWLYHGFLFVPIDYEDHFLESLNEERNKYDWQKELHFKDLKDTRTMNNLAVNWTNLFCCFHYKYVYFYFFGVNYTNLAKQLWANHKERDYKIYNRFFQIGLYGAIKWFFLNKTADFQKVTIEKIFSDSKSRNPEDKFHSKPISEIEIKSIIKDEPIIFNCSEVIEVDSDHRKEKIYKKESHFIQYVDIINGGLSQILDATSKQEGKCQVAQTLLNNNLPEEIMEDEKMHFKSIYYKRYAISFFPRKKISANEIMNSKMSTQYDQFYTRRSLQVFQKNQPSLFEE